jgi:hypothetical protein
VGNLSPYIAIFYFSAAKLSRQAIDCFIALIIFANNTVMKKQIFLALLAFVTLASCHSVKPLKFKSLEEASLRAKRKYLVLNGTFFFQNENEQQVHILELYADITFNGKNVGSVVRKPNQDVPGNQSARVPFYFEADKERVGYDEAVDFAYDVALDGFVKYEMNGVVSSTKFNNKQRLSLGDKTQDSSNNGSNKVLEEKQLKKEQREIRKDGKRKRKHDEISS